MRHEDETRVLVTSVPLLLPDERVAIPVLFGVGRKDRAVRLLSAKYVISGFDAEPEQPVLRWAFALSENPEHELTPPTLTNAIDDKAIYALYHYRSETWLVEALNEGKAAIILQERTFQMPLYRLLRPFRQILLLWNHSDASIKMRAEIYYQPATDVREDIKSINIKYGGYRRT